MAVICDLGEVILLLRTSAIIGTLARNGSKIDLENRDIHTLNPELFMFDTNFHLRQISRMYDYKEKNGYSFTISKWHNICVFKNA